MSKVVGVDVGGTFTDIFYLDAEAGSCVTAKVPSTPADQSEGVLNGIRATGVPAKELTGLVHGTTVGTNALLTRGGARAGLITTAGFRDVLEMRRRDRPSTWGLWGQYQPVVPRDYRLEVAERVLADGTIDVPVDLAGVESAVHELLAAGIESVCVFFVNSYANPANELAAVERVKALWPNEHITCSVQILPEIREFERCSSSVLNAYLQPTVGAYLAKLDAGLRSDGFAADVLIVQSNGGVMAVDTARALPVRTALSGPAAGVIAASFVAQAAGFDNIITCDMGGTSFDVSLVADGAPAVAAQTSIDFGMVVRTPMIEITTIGAGGGSIASFDRGGLLQVGPASAGSDPGPVCYGLGNTEPTVTDANLVLGRINAEAPIGGMMRTLDRAAAAAAIDERIGTRLGLSTEAAAEAIVRVANARMADAIRLVSVERGHDPSRFAAMPFGGGGALHVGALIREVGIASALVPRFPGVISALGCVVADLQHDTVRTLNIGLAELDLTVLGNMMREMAETSHIVIDRAAVPVARIDYRFALDMLYQGQTHTISVVLPAGTPDELTSLTREQIAGAFAHAYQREFGRVLDNIPVRAVNVRVTVTGVRPKFDVNALAPRATGSVEQALVTTRPVWTEDGWQDAHVYARLELPVGAQVIGPAVLEQPDATTYLDPGLQAVIDVFGNLVVRPASD